MTAVNILAGAVCGILSGFGIGGGSLLMIWLTAMVSVEQQAAQSINLLYFLPTAGTALIFHFKNRQVCRKAVLPAALCGCAAAVLGSFLASAVDTEFLRRCFGGFLILVGVSEIFRKTLKNNSQNRRTE